MTSKQIISAAELGLPYESTRPLEGKSMEDVRAMRVTDLAGLSVSDAGTLESTSAAPNPPVREKSAPIVSAVTSSSSKLFVGAHCCLSLFASLNRKKIITHI